MICPKCKHSFIQDVRTNQQNKYFHAILSDINQEIGEWDMEALKILFKDKFGWYKMEMDFDGKPIKIYNTTANMTKEEMSLFTNQITTFAAEFFGMVIQTPEEYFSNSNENTK